METPINANKEVTYFAKTNFRNLDQTFGIKIDDRRRHMYIMGKTGSGKTTLLQNMMLQDIEAGRGVGVVDPHGEFIEQLLERIPSHRVNDVVYFNPADMDFPVAFNILETVDPKYKHLVASNLMGVFTKIWANVWSARMEYILNNAVLALLDSPGSTLLGILRLLVDRDYRQKTISRVNDPVVRSFWVNEYDRWTEKFRNEAIAPIQNKVGQFLSTSLIRNIVGQSQSTINIPEIMDSGKIFLIDVSKGRIGEDNSALLGAMLITRIQLAAMERVRIPELERRDFYLYVDEFQNFVTDAFASILSEARKYRLNLIVAHQYIGQLVGADNSTKVRDAIFGNVGTLIIFRVGASDAEFLEKEFTPEFIIDDLVNLPNFNIYLRLMIDGITSRPFSASTLPPFSGRKIEGNGEKIIKLSRERYTNPKLGVERKIAKWSGILEEEEIKGEIKREPAGKYGAICSSCGKSTFVSFKPDGFRPVYCPECLLKIKEERVKLPQREKAQYPDTLKELGIGIAAGSESESRQNKTAALKENDSSMSLSDLNKKPPIFFKRKSLEQKKRKEVDIKGLRETLKETLGETLPPSQE